MRGSMRPAWAVPVLLACWPVFDAPAQTWEVGLGGSWAFHRSVPVSGKLEKGEVGFGSSGGGVVWIQQRRTQQFGGQLSYSFQRQPLQLKVESQRVRFAGYTHAVHYSFWWGLRGASGRFEPFVIAGVGVKGYFGTGREMVYQPGQSLALLTKTSEWKPSILVGAGLRWRLSPATLIHLQLHDATTPFPQRVIAPAPGAKISGWMHSLVPLLGVSYQW